MSARSGSGVGSGTPSLMMNAYAPLRSLPDNVGQCRRVWSPKERRSAVYRQPASIRSTAAVTPATSDVDAERGSLPSAYNGHAGCALAVQSSKRALHASLHSSRGLELRTRSRTSMPRRECALYESHADKGTCDYACVAGAQRHSAVAGQSALAPIQGRTPSALDHAS